MLSGFVVAILAFVTYSALRRLWMRHFKLVRRDEAGLLRVELRRHIDMRSHPDGSGGQSFPEPVETRDLTWLFCELPVWNRSESIGLPSSCEGRVEQVRAEEFDQHFTPAFRMLRAVSKPSRTAAA